MLDSSAPTCEAWISPDLLGLLRGRLPSERKVPELVEQPDEKPCPVATTEETPEPYDAPTESREGHEQQMPSAPVLLRVDGDRPLRFHGMLLFQSTWHWHSEQGAAEPEFVQELKLFLSRDQEVIAHAVCRPMQNQSMRPLYRSAHIAHHDHLLRLLHETRPSGMFDMLAVFAPSAVPQLKDTILHVPGLMLP